MRVDGDTQTVIYTGRAVLRDTSGPVRRVAVRVNSIVRDYMARPQLPDLNGYTEEFMEADTLTTFRYYDNLTARGEDTFINDWSYDYGYDYATEDKGLSFPITGRFSPAQKLVLSVVDAVFLAAEIKDAGGDVIALRELIGEVGDFNLDFNGDFRVIGGREEARSGFVVLDMASYPGAAEVTVSVKMSSGKELHQVYRVADTCSRYVLYYLNAYGGWDFLLMEGQPSLSAGLTRHTVKPWYNNSDPFARGELNFCNESSPEWTLRTGWLSDEQSGLMHHLLGSTDVYMTDLESGLTMPVTLTDTDVEYRTYRSNGCRLVNYEATARLAQDRQRR